MQTVEEYLDTVKQQRAKIWDEKERLWYLSPERDCFSHTYASFPLRITRDEWQELAFTTRGEDMMYCHHRFTLYRSLVFVPGWDYCDVFEVTLRNGKNREFGPHKSLRLASEKTLDFLIEHHAVEILEKGQ